jgi:hypothetical protein
VAPRSRFSGARRRRGKSAKARSGSTRRAANSDQADAYNELRYRSLTSIQPAEAAELPGQTQGLVTQIASGAESGCSDGRSEIVGPRPTSHPLLLARGATEILLPGGLAYSNLVRRAAIAKQYRLCRRRRLRSHVIDRRAIRTAAAKS